MTLPQEVVEQDNKLETTAERSRIKLAEHRWHWTLDESNPDRVGIREYARQIARSHVRVLKMVNAYATWAGTGARTDEFADYVAREELRGETLQATEAVAQARGVSLDTARRHHADEVREVKATAQERAERKGSTVEEELAPVAEQRETFRKAGEKVREREKEEKKQRHSWQYIKIEGKIAQALHSLRDVLNESEGVEFSAEERELLADSIGKLRALLNLLDMRLTGTTDVNWDAEFAKLVN